MTGNGRFVGGFFLGTAVTVAVTHILAKRAKKKIESKYNDRQHREQENKRNGRSLRSPGRSSYAAASTSVEHVSFLTEILAQLWDQINIAGAKMIKEAIEPTFVNTMPGPLSKLHFTKIDLGNVPMRLDNIVVHEIINGVLQFDIDVIWDGECDIQLHADFVGSLGVKSIKLCGRMSMLLKPLTNEVPIVSGVQYSFINTPDLELDFTGLAEVVDLKVLKRAMCKAIDGALEEMVVLPVRMLYKTDLGCSFFDIYEPPIGVARITAVNGQGFEVEKRVLGRKDVPDVYATIKLGNKTWKTFTVKNDIAPEWNETADFLLCDHDQRISIHAFDEDSGALDPDDDLGTAQLTVGELLLAGRTMGMELQNEGKMSGASITLHCDVLELTKDLSSFDMQRRGGDNFICGLLTILVSGAFNLPVKKEEASSFVKVTYGTYEFFTGTVVDYLGCDALNPLYDCAFHVPLTPEMMSKGDGTVVFSLMNGKEDNVGTTTVTHTSLIESVDKTITDRRLLGNQGASLEFRVAMHGIHENVNSANNNSSESSSTRASNNLVQSISIPSHLVPANKSTGTVRITALKGRGFKVQKSKMVFKKDDIPDVYCKIKFGTSSKGWQKVFRTSTIRNNVEPEWNESADFSLVDHGQVITIDVFDEDKGGKGDDALGSARVKVGKLLLAAGGVMDVKLQIGGKYTGAVVTFRGDMIKP